VNKCLQNTYLILVELFGCVALVSIAWKKKERVSLFHREQWNFAGCLHTPLPLRTPSKQVTWCFTPSKPLRLYQGETDTKHQDGKKTSSALQYDVQCKRKTVVFRSGSRLNANPCASKRILVTSHHGVHSIENEDAFRSFFN